MAEQYVAAVDQGTTSTRCILFDRRGRLVSVAQREHQQLFPRPGWVEHDAGRDLAQRRPAWRPPRSGRSAPSPAQVAAIGIANQRETTRALGPAHRPADRPRDRLAGHPDRRGSSPNWPAPRARTGSRSCCGLPLATYFSAPRMQLAARPHTRAAGARRARRGAVRHDGELADLEPHRRRAGGLHVTDVTNASRTMLMDIETLDWDDRLLAVLRRPARDAARRSGRRPRSTATATDGAARGPDRRGARRSAGRAVRADLLQRRARPSARTAPAASCCCNTGHGDRPVDARPAHHGRATRSGRAGRRTRWKARSRSPARWCSGSATGSG